MSDTSHPMVRRDVLSVRSVTPPPSYITVPHDALPAAVQDELPQYTRAHGPVPGPSRSPDLLRASSRSPLSQPVTDPVVLRWQEEVYAGEVVALQVPAKPEPVTYQFSQIGSNTILLTPSRDAQDQRPLYHISWYEDYFVPYNWITTIRRGGASDGQYVGMFDLKGGRREGVIQIGSVNKWLPTVLKGTYGALKWQFNTPTPLVWEQGRSRTCRLDIKGRPLLARFVPAQDSVGFLRDYVDKLEVQPAGCQQELLDEIVLSILLIQRRERRMQMTPA